MSDPAPECPACGCSLRRWVGRFGASGQWRHVFQCRAPGCLLVYRDPGAMDDNDPPCPDTRDGDAPPTFPGEAESLRGLKQCLPPPAVLSLPEGNGRLRFALESAGYMLGQDGPSRTFLVTDALLRDDRPRDLLDAFQTRVGADGLLILHLPRYENAFVTGSLSARPPFRPEYVSYFSFYSLVNLLWRTGFLAEEWFLDEPAHCMTIRAVRQASVPPLTGDWEADRDRHGSTLRSASVPGGDGALTDDHTEQRCFNCGSSQSRVLFESLVDRDGNHTSIEVCPSCTVLYNTYLRSQGILGENATRFQASAVERVYATTEEDREAVGRRRDACAPILKFLLDDLGLPRRRAACLEIGAGGGYLTALASQFFTRAYACEFDLREVTKTVAALGIGNMRAVADLAEVKEALDLVLMWHSLEHIAEPLNFLRGVRTMMADDGVLYFQVPLYRKNYVFPSHLWFFNSFAVKKLREALGFATERVVFDTANDYMSVVFHQGEGSVRGVDR